MSNPVGPGPVPGDMVGLSEETLNALVQYPSEYTWGEGTEPDLADEKLSVKHAASKMRREGLSERG